MLRGTTIMTDRICVGGFAGSFGVKGEVRLKSFCANPGDIATYGPLHDETAGRSFSVTLTGATKNGLTARVDGIHTKEQADELRATSLYIERAKLPSLPDDEYYHADLIGLTVLDTGGIELGRVKTVLNHGAADLLEIQSERLDDTVLLPFTLAAVPTVDLASGRIIVDPPDGVFPE
jgi:16S rRNA processing protein RimM